MKPNLSELDFLREKIALFHQAIGRLGPLPENPMELSMLEHLVQKQLTSSSELKKFEKGIQQFWYELVSRSEIDAIHRQLREKYGYHGLSETPQDILKRVLKRGSLKTLDEAETVRGLVANVEQKEMLGPVNFAKLCEMVERFELGRDSSHPITS
jgi:hypothetical protein